MTKEAKLISGWILLSVPTIIYGGYFLLTVLGGQQEHLQLTDFQKAMFRAGHAHAGVLIILSLVMQLFIDSTRLPPCLKWIARLSFPVAVLFISGGFFAAAIGKGVNSPTGLIALLYIGIVIFVTGLITSGIGLVKNK